MHIFSGSTGVLFAHAFGQRYELPIPLVLFVVGGALIVLLSFLLVLPTAVAKRSSVEDADETALRPYKSWPAAVSYLVLMLLIAAGAFGSQEVAENIVPTVFWLVAWIAVPLSCGIIGDWTQRLNPFANIAKLADSSRLRKLLIGVETTLPWPKALGWWPAVVLFFGLAASELIFNQAATQPLFIAVMLGVYAIASAVMGLLFGSAWLRRGEVFTVLFSTWGKLGYFRFGSQGRRGFAGGLASPFEDSPSRITFVLLLLVSVSFDGLLATPAWNRAQLSLPSGLQSGDIGLQLLTLVAFVVLAVAVWLLFKGFAYAVRRSGRLTGSTSKVLAGLLGSLVPISFGYLLAHNLEYLIVNGQLLFPLLGNPVGSESWPLHLPNPFNDSYEPRIHLLPSSFYWYLAVAVIVAVHIIAIVLAHRYLGSSAPDKSRARRAEYPWIAAMVLYTMLSLWLLAQPLVQEAHAEPAEASESSSHAHEER